MRKIISFFAIIGSPPWTSAVAETPLRQELMQVQAGQSFDINLSLRAGTGTTWVLTDSAGIKLDSQRANSMAEIPGGPRAQTFVFQPPKPGHYKLRWNLVRGSQTVYEVFELDLQVNQK